MNWTRRVGLLCLGLVSLGLAKVSSSQDPVVINNADGLVYLDDVSGSAFLSQDGGNYILFNKVVGDGVGHAEGFSRIGVRTRLWENFDQHLFGEVHSMITDHGRLGYNVGGGYRRQVGGGILGVHGWYDDFDSTNENRYRQITTGFEYLHPIFDIRSNGYIPIDERENFVRVVDPGTDVSFLENHLVTAGVGAFERAYYGWDLEGGGPVPLAENWLRTYLGVYQLLFDDDTTTGVRSRTEARFMEGVNLNFIVSNDDKFGTNLNLGVEVRFRGTMPTRFQSGFTADRRYDQVRRTWPIQTSVELEQIPVALNKPGTMDPIHIIHIDNTNPGGVGTFEDPRGDLPGTDPDADLFLVRFGAGDTLGNITLLDNQQLLGEGFAQFVDTDRLGVIQLPDTFDQTSGLSPTLRAADAGMPIVTLASGNVVSSFNLAGTDGIVGTDIDSFLIERIHSDEITNGINITNASGVGFLTNIDFDLADGGTGIRVTNSTGDPLDLAMDTVMVNQGANGVVVEANGANITFDIDNVTVANTTTQALGLHADSADLTGTADNVTTDGNAGNGVMQNLVNATGTTTFTTLNSSGNGVDGLQAIASAGSNYNLNVIDSTLEMNGDDNIQTDALGAMTVLNVFVDPTSIINATDNGYEFLASNGGTLNATFIDVDITGSMNNAIAGVVESGSNATLDFGTLVNAGFDATGAVNDGLNLKVTDQSSLTGTFTNGNFSDSGSNAIQVDATKKSTVDLTFTNVTADNMAADGNVVWRASTGADVTTKWDGGSISNGAATGVTIEATGVDSVVDASIANTTIDDNAGAGIDASMPFGMNNAALFLDLNTVSTSRNGTKGVQFDASGPGVPAILTADNLTSVMNGEEGLNVVGTGGALVGADLINSDFSSNGTSGMFSGVKASSEDLNTEVVLLVDATDSNSNSLHGFEFSANDNGSLFASFGSGGIGPVTASMNDGSGVDVSGTDIDEIVLLGEGENVFQDNGQVLGTDGIHVDINRASFAVISTSGEVTGSGRDGVRIQMQDVVTGGIEVLGDGTTALTGNAGHGVNIQLLDTNLTGLNIDGVDLSDNGAGFNGLNIVADNSDVVDANILNVTSLNNENGVVIELTNGSDWNITASENTLGANNVYGMHISSDSSDTTNVINLNNNDLVSNLDTNLRIDLSGTADFELHVDENIIDGDGRIAGFTKGLEIFGDVSGPGKRIPPDTMGAVGINHIVEVTNNEYALFNKTTGALLLSLTPDQFWTLAGAPPNSQFDPRIIYDPASNRWFVTAIDGGNPNTIYVAVSNTEDPTDGFQSVSFVGDTLGNIRFNDYDTLAVDADGLYITTNNFIGGFADVSIYSIPKADLIAAVPAASNITRFENLDASDFGFTLQPVVDFGASNGKASFLATNGGAGNRLYLTELSDTGTNNAQLLGTTEIFVDNYQSPQGGNQPFDATPLNYDDSRITGNVVKVNGTIWGVHGTLTDSGTDGVRWYQIDEATQTVLQSGTLEDPSLDMIYPSIAINEDGQAVIGMTLTGPGQFASTAAVFGETQNGQMTFNAPVVLQNGVNIYEVFDGSGRNRWGDYSATVVDPINDKTFWTFQEMVSGLDESTVTITQINYSSDTIAGDTLVDGISLNVSGDAIVRDSTFTFNSISGNMTNAITINASDNAEINELDVLNNMIFDNGMNTPVINNTSGGTVIINQ